MLAGVLIIPGLCLAPAAMAQTAASPAGSTPSAQDQSGPPTSVGEVVVTGSRIPRREVDAPQPTVVIGVQKIQDSGDIDLGQLISQSPLFQPNSETTGPQAANAIGGNAGVSFANLYNLGAQRTLTLIDGKRTVGSAAASGAADGGLQVDLSAIPIGLIDRVETISVGGAPIYGSDAIAGTVNIILKQNYEGLNLDTQAGVTEDGDGAQERIQVLFGHNFDDGRGNITLSAAYTKADGITSAERGFDTPSGEINPLGNPNQYAPTFGAVYPFLSPYGVPSNFFGIVGVNQTTGAPVGTYLNAAGQPLRFDNNGNLVAFNPGKPLSYQIAGLGAVITQVPSSDTVTTRAVNPILSPSDRTYVNGMAHYDLTDHLRAVLRFSYERTGASLTAQGNVPTSSIFGLTAVAQPQTIAPSNPFLTPASRAFFLANPNPVLGSNDFSLSRSYDDVTSGRVNVDQNTYTVQGGFEGDFNAFGRNFKWDVTASDGRTERGNTTVGVLSTRLGYALNSVLTDPTMTNILPTPANLDPATFSFNPSTGLYTQSGTGDIITCQVRVAGMAPAGANPADVSACAPYNPFGEKNPQGALNYLRGQSIQDYTVEQKYIQGNVNGTLFDLPAGPFQASAGFEIRQEHATYALDAATATGQFLGGSTGAGVNGGFQTNEVYGEARIPVISGDMMQKAFGHRLFDGLEFDGAVRFMNNSRAGNDVTYTAGGRLDVTRDLAFRGNFTHSIRQPAISELFAGDIPQFSSVSDPCSLTFIATGPNPAVRRKNCEQEVINSGLATNTAGADAFLANFSTPLGGVPGSFSGNPNLKSETADSYTFGATFTPRFLPGFSATIDYINIQIQNEISAIDGSGVADNCVDNPGGLNNPYCPSIQRGPNFQIIGFSSYYANVDLHQFAGITATAKYVTDLSHLFTGRQGEWGAIAFDGTFFYLNHDRDGTLGQLIDDTGATGEERFRAQVGLGWNFRRFGAYVQESYYSPSKLDPNGTEYLYNNVPAYYLTNLTVRYNITPKVRASLTVSNLFDKGPPFNAYSYEFDQIGRRFLMGLNATF